MNQTQTQNKLARAQMIAAAAALSSVIEADECQAWLRTMDGQCWLSGLRMNLDCGDPIRMDAMDAESFRFDQEAQECAPRSAA